MQPYKQLSTTPESGKNPPPDFNQNDESALSLNSALLLQQATNEALSCLLNESNPAIALLTALTALAEAGKCSEVHIFEIDPAVGSSNKLQLFFGIKKESQNWVRSENDPLSCHLAEQLQRELDLGKRASGKTAPFAGQSLSFLWLPVVVAERVWGGLLFTYEKPEEVWGEDEEQIIAIMAPTLGNYIERTRRERKLTNKQDYLHKIIDLNPSFIFARNREGQFTLVNQSLAKAYGTTADELLHKKDADFLLNAEEIARIQEEDLAIMNSLQAKFVPIQEIVDLKGNKRYLQIIKSPVVRENGKADEVLGVAVDITEEHKARQKAEKEQQFKESVIATIPDHIVIVDKENRTADYFNAKGAFLGYKFSELNDPYIFFKQRIHPNDFDLAVNQFQKRIECAAAEEILETTYRMQHKNGEWLWFYERSKVFSRHTDGKVKEYLIFLQEITEKKWAEEALKESEQRLEMAISGASLGIWDWDISTGKATYNEEWANLLGLGLEEIEPKLETFTSLVHPEDITRAWDKIQEHIQKKTEFFEVEFRMKTKSGDWKWIYDRGRVVQWDENGLPLRASGTHMDIDERKKAEMGLAEKFKELDEKNRELRRYIDSNMQLENFAYIASHDLKEPLRTIGNFAQLLQKRYGDHLDQSGNEYLGFIVGGAKNMNQLIEDLLAYSRVNTQEHTIEEININNLLLLIQHSLNNYIQEKQAIVEIKPMPEKIQANRTKIKQLFQNLIVNAIKFHKPGEKSRVLLECEDADSHWLFKISDEGIGIEEDFHEKIFLLFKKLHTRKEYQGTGIGLALCKKVVDQHGGKIWVESKPGQGTTFFFTIEKNPKVG